MRYVAGVLYGLAAFSGTAQFWNSVGIGACVALATIALAFAMEGIVRHELWRASHPVTRDTENPPRRREKRRPF
jgi:hypothetical protein